MREQNVAKGGGLEPKVMFSKYELNWGRAVKRLMQRKRITDGGLGAWPPASGGYGQFL